MVDVDTGNARVDEGWRTIALVLLFGWAIRAWIFADDGIGYGFAVFWSIALVALGLRARAEVARDREARR